ncbi:hypothetical protein C8J57DRAFT_1284294 [Mycena rebaudengoi]|nr:hypothetical protein C8J57DRAFT_1284294 [Mycena rebaudengoi]
MQGAKKPPMPPLPPLPLAQDHRGSIMPITPGVSSAVSFMIGQERELSAAAEREREKAMAKEREREREKDKGREQEKEREQEQEGESKEAWRRSDATITHQTVRPGAATATRASRPVSMADSLVSTHTVVPGAGANKRLSALVADADFGMAEEDEVGLKNQSPPPSSVRSKPRSMSLNTDLPQSYVKPAPPLHSPWSPSEPVAPPISPSTSRETPTLTRAAANGIIAPSSSGLQSTGNNIRGRLAAWTATNNTTASKASSSTPRLDRQQSPSAPPRQPALSISGGFAPAAGLAKRAVERMGRAWGGISSGSNNSGYSSSSSTPPSSYSSAEYGLVRTNSNNSGAPGKGPKHRRTPNSNSSNWSVHSTTTSSSISDSDAFVAPPGPVLGKRLRGPLKVTTAGASVTGVVFGGRLKVVVSETAVTAGGRRARDIGDEGHNQEQGSLDLPHPKLLEHRLLPALVVRCAQHLLIWGVQEEGLFRVTGRPSHIAKLRSEFDSGADFDMTECTPGDLDPHAVASVFKAFLRELPEPILTQSLIPYFEAALAQEGALNEQNKPTRTKGAAGPGLPSGPKGLPQMRKPPSLSTLAMPNFTSIRPPSQSLLNALKSLIVQLPPENRDLIRTVTELIKETAKHSKETKMPLSNLLLVFCPSLNMNPPLLRVLCEAEGIWGDQAVLGHPVESDVVDIRRQTVLDIGAPKPTGDSGEPVPDVAAMDVPSPQPESPPSPTDVVRPRSPGARNQRTHPAAMYLEDEAASLSQVSRMLAENQTSPQSKALMDDVSSVSTSEDASMAPRLDAPSPLLSSSAESLATPKGFDDKPPLVIAESPEPRFNTPPRRPTITGPLGSPIQFPTTSGNSPQTPLSASRSVPTLSLPSLPSPTYDGHNSASSAPPSPLFRLKKPSLHLLFTKRSASPLSPGGRPFISSPYLQSSRAASDSSLSTPVSAVTAPQGSSLTLPPVLNTPIESSRLRLDLGLEVDSPNSSPKLEQETPDSPSSDESLPIPAPGQTPIADWYRTPASSSVAVNHLRPHPTRNFTRKASQASIGSTTSSNRLGILDGDENEENWTKTVLLAADVDWTLHGP